MDRTMSSHLLNVAAAVDVAALLASCSAGTTGGSGAPQNGGQPAGTTGQAGQAAGGSVPDACSVLSKAEVAAAAGVTVHSDGVKKDGNTCDYESVGGVGGALSIRLDTTTKEQFSQKKLAGHEVPGIGDGAVDLATTLIVLRGTTEVTVVYISSAGLATDALPVEKKVATKVVAKL
jgi:hypothetical protein